MKEKEKNNICLLFPPLIGNEACPPAGIPSLTAFLKARGYNPLVLDMNFFFKKTNFIYKVLLYFHYKIISLRKSNDSIKKNSINSQSYHVNKRLIKKIGSLIYTRLKRIRESLFNENIPNLENVFKMLEKKTNYKKLCKYFKPVLEHAIKDKKILGISVVYPSQIFYAFIIAKLAKEINLNIFIVLGGSQITMHIDKFISNNSLLDYIDSFIVREGEEGLYALLEGESLSRIPNLYYKEKNSYKPSELVDFVMEVKKYMTPDFDGFDFNAYAYPVLPIRTLRGCFWGKCRFCTYPYISGKLGFTDVNFVIESIIKLQKKYNIHKFEFVDSSLPANFLRQIATCIIENNLNIRWHCRADFELAFKDSELVKLLKKSGCESFAMGVESGSNRIIRYMKKIQNDKGTVEEIIRVLNQHDINVIIYIMLGFPTETVAEINETIYFVMMLKKHFRVILSGTGIFNLLEHSYIYNNPKEFKITKIYQQSIGSFQGYGYRFDCSEGASREEINHLHKKANLFIKYPILYNLKNLFTLTKL